MELEYHISEARRIIDSGQTVNLKVWKKDGSVMELKECVGMRYNFRQGTRQIKVLASRQIRTIRDVFIFELNGKKVYI